MRCFNPYRRTTRKFRLTIYQARIKWNKFRPAQQSISTGSV